MLTAGLERVVTNLSAIPDVVTMVIALHQIIADVNVLHTLKDLVRTRHIAVTTESTAKSNQNARTVAMDMEPVMWVCVLVNLVGQQVIALAHTVLVDVRTENATVLESLAHVLVTLVGLDALVHSRPVQRTALVMAIATTEIVSVPLVTLVKTV